MSYRSWQRPLWGSTSQSAGGGGGGPVFGGLIPLPAGVPTPIVWLSPDFVTLDAGGTVVDVIVNRGSGGDIYDAVPRTANKLRITAAGTWGGKNVFDTTAHTSGGYQMGVALPTTRTFMAMSTYLNGNAVFTGFDAIVSGDISGASSEFELVGNQNSARFFGKCDIVYKNGVALATPTTDVLPLLKNTVAGVESTDNVSSQVLFADNFASSRYWEGLTGEMMLWDTILTPTQIANLHTNMEAYYA